MARKKKSEIPDCRTCGLCCCAPYGQDISSRDAMPCACGCVIREHQPVSVGGRGQCVNCESCRTFHTPKPGHPYRDLPSYWW